MITEAFLSLFPVKAPYDLHMVMEEQFGFLPDGREVRRYVLENNQGMRVSILNYGVIVQELFVPDAKGIPRDVVLGYPDLQDYLNSHDRMGALLGRVAGRMTPGRFHLNGEDISLTENDPPHHLHGGQFGLGKRLWSLVDIENHSIRMRYVSPHGEEGYPGDLDILVTYTLTDHNELLFKVRAESDRLSPFSPSPQLHFNLSGDPRASIRDHILTVFAEEYYPRDETMRFRNIRESVHGSPCDLNHCTRMGDVLAQLDQQHGDLYQVRKTRKGDFVPAARLDFPANGLTLDVATTECCLQVCTGSHFQSPTPGKQGYPHPPFSGVALCCHGFPNSVRVPELGNIFLRPGLPSRSQSVFRFRTQH